jgi:hypothetical protein
MDEKPFRISLPLTRPHQAEVYAFASAMAIAEPFSNVRCRVFEVTRSLDGAQVEVVHLAEGEINTAIANPDQREGLVELEFIFTKMGTQGLRAGLPANPTCSLVYGGPGCLSDNSVLHNGSSYFPNHYASGKPKIRRAFVEMQFAETRRSQLVMLTISATQHAGADQRTLTTMPRGWWLGSYLSYRGLSIPIRDWWWNLTLGTGTSSFVLGKIPPQSWAYGGTNPLLLVPGCPKTRTACDARNNLSNWGAYGYGIPAYNPLFDERN